MPLETIHYPHPHVDPRQPRQDSKARTNPPVFAWKPDPSQRKRQFRLQVGTDEKLKKRVLDEKDLADPVFLPEKALAPGTYYWRWSQGDAKSEVFRFKIPKSSVKLEVPSARDWLDCFSGEHPRFLFPEKPDANTLEVLRDQDPDSIQNLLESAEAELGKSHHMAEPPYKPDKEKDYQKFRKVQYTVMWGSRKFASGAKAMAMAYTLTGRQEFGKAAARRLASLAKWDPHGSTHLEANDEPHMSVIWHGALAADWCWDCFTKKQREAVIAQMRERAKITFECMHDRGQYGIERFDSHAGREIVFLANLLLIFHDHIPEAEDWLNWLRPTLCGIWPIWAEDDGAWAEGISYSLAYVEIMTIFASALKRSTGVDLYRRPFWKNYARWRQAMMPPYAEWIGFGDHSERWPQSWLRGADVVELIGRETATREFDFYFQELRREAESMPPTPPERAILNLTPQLLLCPLPKNPDPAPEQSRQDFLHSFPGAGWAAFRRNLKEADQDIALIFRSSPFGSVSHSHANNNDVAIHVAGKAMAIPTGYYAGYGSPHHGHWVWHTKSHNCVTLSGAPQLLRSPDSRGELLSHYEDEHIAYILGNADEGYQDRAQTCRRHLVFFKTENTFLLLDHFVAKPGMTSSFQWNFHSWYPFKVKEKTRQFSLTRQKRVLQGHILFQKDVFYSLTEGWDPPFSSGLQNTDQWYQQYHLRVTPTPYLDEVRFGVLLSAQAPALSSPDIVVGGDDQKDTASLGQASVEIFQKDQTSRKNSLATIQVQGQSYRIGKSGIKKD